MEITKWIYLHLELFKTPIHRKWHLLCDRLEFWGNFGIHNHLMYFLCVKITPSTCFFTFPSTCWFHKRYLLSCNLIVNFCPSELLEYDMVKTMEITCYWTRSLVNESWFSANSITTAIIYAWEVLIKIEEHRSYKCN